MDDGGPLLSDPQAVSLDELFEGSRFVGENNSHEATNRALSFRDDDPWNGLDSMLFDGTGPSWNASLVALPRLATASNIAEKPPMSDETLFEPYEAGFSLEELYTGDSHSYANFNFPDVVLGACPAEEPLAVEPLQPEDPNFALDESNARYILAKHNEFLASELLGHTPMKSSRSRRKPQRYVGCSEHRQDQNEVPKGKRPRLSPKMVDLLKEWFISHETWPFPSEDETQRLALESDSSVKQVKAWFNNARSRFKGKGTYIYSAGANL